MTDLFAKCHGDGGYFGKFRKLGNKYYSQPVLEGPPDTRMTFRGKEVVMWAINNYLGLTGHEEIKAVARKSLEKWGTYSPMGSRLLTGNNPRHEEVEKKFADYLQKQHAILFNYGYLGVVGTITSLIGKNDQVLIDRLAHASMIDGAMLASVRGRKAIPFRHNDMNHLEELLKQTRRETDGGILIVTEGVYGMRGDIADLKGICELKEKYGARLFVDDAHGFGVVGSQGRGSADLLGVHDKVDLYFGTFAKAYAAIGGVMAGEYDPIEWVRYNARTNVFAKTLPMIYADVVARTMEIVRDGDHLRERMWTITRRLQDGLRELGYDLGDTVTPITPLYVPTGTEEEGAAMIALLRDKFGIFVSGVTAPVVPRGIILFRMIPTAAHTEEDVDRTLAAFKAMRDIMKLDLSLKPSRLNE